MNSSKSPEQELAENVKALGADLGETFTFLVSDFEDLLSQWDMYRAFFGTNPKRVELLNSVSGKVAHRIQTSLFQSVLLGLSKISEPMKGSPEKSQISIDKLQFFTSEDSGKRTLKSLSKRARNKCKFAKNWSDKMIAHNDWTIRTGQAELEIATRQKIEEALQSIAEVIQFFGQENLDRTYIFEFIEILNGDELTFLEVLYEGEKVVRARKDERDSAFHNWQYESPTSTYKYPDWLQRAEAPNWRSLDFGG